MRKILNKSYLCLIYVFFALFTLVLRMDANDNQLIYIIGLIVACVFLPIILFFTNKCKKASVRTLYLTSMISISITAILICVSYLLVNVVSNNDLLLLIQAWIIRLFQAIQITFVLCTIYYTVKDFFKKGYELQKFDFHCIQMVINLLTYLAFFYVIFDYGQPAIELSIGGFSGLEDKYMLVFSEYNVIKNAILLISLLYIIIYVLIEVIKYKKFEKFEEDPKKREFK